ncbi:calpain-B-like [Lingula anatina]|uniref:Calpain-B-like n=1 Tax=Lingula anatina TaxID=7574 RepID=A0A1S3IH80_LINAN|nr:calpain-B-like [Lingula anatina]|eukprot:XP_013396844.2 calpain-B-like [Lingula anatina]
MQHIQQQQQNLNRVHQQQQENVSPQATEPWQNAATEIIVESMGEVVAREASGEEKEPPLPEAEYGDFNLGITPMDAVTATLANLGGRLFEDPDFPATSASLTYLENPPAASRQVVWLRPKDIVGPGKQPQLIKDGISRSDIDQGSLADCWFLSACAAVSARQKFMKIIIPDNQVLTGPEYHGIVWFRFWRFGKWYNVCVDDRLPTKNGKLFYGSCDDSEEFWVPLLEKAYAKLHGSYEALCGGHTMNALLDLTGGLGEKYEVALKAEEYQKLFLKILHAHRSGAFICASKRVQGQGQTEEVDKEGLVSGHAYTITNVVILKQGNGLAHLIRVRNPWNSATEWNGAWSDGHEFWNLIDKSVKEKLGLTHKADGEFWMDYRDFAQRFSIINICSAGPDFDGDGIPDQYGHVVMAFGNWVAGQTAGGRRTLETYTTNPQYLLHVTHTDNFNGDPTVDRCSIVISLMQEYRMSSRTEIPKAHYIGFHLYNVKPADSYARKVIPIGLAEKEGPYLNCRHVSERFHLKPGYYLFVPSTYDPYKEGTFLLRIFGVHKFEFIGPLQHLPNNG